MHRNNGSARHGTILLGAVVLAATTAYAVSAPRCVLGGDNGEFSTLYETGGIAHPPGFPAVVLWLRAFHGLAGLVSGGGGSLFDTPAHGAALATVVTGALAVFALQRACLAWGAGVGITALVSALFAFSPPAWKLASHAEVFAPNAAVAAAILWLSAPRAPLAPARRIVVLGLLAGVGMAGHQSIVLLAPVGLLAAVRCVRASPHRVPTALLGLAAVLAGVVVPYAHAYFVARTADPRTTWMWIEEKSVAGIWFHFRRGGYGTLNLSGLGQERKPLANVVLLAKSVVRQLLGLPLVALAGGALGIARLRRGEARRDDALAAGALVLTFVLAGPAFVASFNIPLVGAAPLVTERFYVLAELVLSLLGALALQAIAGAWLTRLPVAIAATALVAVAAASLSVPEVREHHRPTVENYLLNSLKSAPPDAIVVTQGDHELFGFLYAQNALHLRPDVTLVNPGPLGQRWYREDILARTGVSLEAARGGPVDPLTMANRLAATGRPLLFTSWPDPKLARAAHFTVGTLMRAVTPGVAVPEPDELARANEELFGEFRLEPTLPEDPHGWGAAVMSGYARPWLELANAFAARGDLDRAEVCFAHAKQFVPTLVRAAR